MTTPKTDRDLLEMAAKAAGIDGRYFEGVTSIHTGIYRDGLDCYWNPIISDSEALRLAVKLHIGIRSHGPTHWHQPNTSVALYEIGEDVGGRIQVQHGDDPSHATRRAIVRAAAEIGRAMP